MGKGSYESTALFFLLVDILFREYLIYVESQSMIREEYIDEAGFKDK